VYVCVYVCACANVCVRMCVCACVCVRICAYVCVCARVHVSVNLRLCAASAAAAAAAASDLHSCSLVLLHDDRPARLGKFEGAFERVFALTRVLANGLGTQRPRELHRHVSCHKGTKS